MNSAETPAVAAMLDGRCTQEFVRQMNLESMVDFVADIDISVLGRIKNLPFENGQHDSYKNEIFLSALTNLENRLKATIKVFGCKNGMNRMEGTVEEFERILREATGTSTDILENFGLPRPEKIIAEYQEALKKEMKRKEMIQNPYLDEIRKSRSMLCQMASRLSDSEIYVEFRKTQEITLALETKVASWNIWYELKSLTVEAVYKKKCLDQVKRIIWTSILAMLLNFSKLVSEKIPKKDHKIIESIVKFYEPFSKLRVKFFCQFVSNLDEENIGEKKIPTGAPTSAPSGPPPAKAFKARGSTNVDSLKIPTKVATEAPRFRIKQPAHTPASPPPGSHLLRRLETSSSKSKPQSTHPENDAVTNVVPEQIENPPNPSIVIPSPKRGASTRTGSLKTSPTNRQRQNLEKKEESENIPPKSTKTEVLSLPPIVDPCPIVATPLGQSRSSDFPPKPAIPNRFQPVNFVSSTNAGTSFILSLPTISPAKTKSPKANIVKKRQLKNPDSPTSSTTSTSSGVTSALPIPSGPDLKLTSGQSFTINELATLFQGKDQDIQKVLAQMALLSQPTPDSSISTIPSKSLSLEPLPSKSCSNPPSQSECSDPIPQHSLNRILTNQVSNVPKQNTPGIVDTPPISSSDYKAPLPLATLQNPPLRNLQLAHPYPRPVKKPEMLPVPPISTLSPCNPYPYQYNQMHPGSMMYPFQNPMTGSCLPNYQSTPGLMNGFNNLGFQSNPSNSFMNYPGFGFGFNAPQGNLPREQEPVMPVQPVQPAPIVSTPMNQQLITNFPAVLNSLLDNSLKENFAPNQNDAHAYLKCKKWRHFR